ncbi:hypothetical protein FORC41_2548 [Escherichia coli]|nr:hypothetical protein FORC41_2548 [Escherichia coli]
MAECIPAGYSFFGSIKIKRQQVSQHRSLPAARSTAGFFYPLNPA